MSNPLRSTSFVASVLLGVALLWMSQGAAYALPEGEPGAPPAKAPKDSKAGAGGKIFSNPVLGIQATTPKSWKLSSNTVAVSSWSPIATFADPAKGSDTKVVLYSRSRKAKNLIAMEPMVRTEWTQDSKKKLKSIVRLDVSSSNPVPKVIVDGSFIDQGKAGADGVKPPPVSYTLNDTYFLAAEREFKLSVKARSTLWSRVRPLIEELRKSVKLIKADRSGPTGVGSFRCEKHGFVCRYPKSYTVVMPRFKDHIIDFQGRSPDAPTLGVYMFEWSKSAEKDADRLEAFYQNEQEAQVKVVSGEVAGSTGFFVNARVSLGGEDKLVLLAITKRGDHCMRLKAVMPVAKEAQGRAMFRKFLDSFNFRRVSK